MPNITKGDNEEDTGKRTAAVDARERAVTAREKAVLSRERASTTDERAVSEREDSASTREEVVRLREELVRAREEAAEAKSEQDRLLGDVKEANEKLVIASIHSQELAEVAEEARRQLELTGQELREVAGFRDLLIGIVSHDLRNPLSSIRMALDILATQPLDSDSKALVGRLRGSTLRMGEMIGQLLDFTRAHVGAGLPIALKSTNLEDVCRRSIEELELGHSTPVRFVCEFHGDLSGIWDPDRLAQVISNLGANALAHGAPEVPIAVSARDEGEHVLLEITNRGEPIPSELLPFIFDPFRRARQKAKAGGLGLGLYISHQIVLAHGGTIAVYSDAAEGTTFAVRLPRRPPRQEGEV
jgi:signal transduction histidine kinase